MQHSDSQAQLLTDLRTDYNVGSGSTGSSILTLLSVASDIYSKLNYDDVDCQKKIICEFMQEPEMFGQGGSRVKTGVQWAASWLQPLGFGIVDQISEAATLDEEVALVLVLVLVVIIDMIDVLLAAG